MTLGNPTLKEKNEIETKFGKALGTIQCFLDPTCKDIAYRPYDFNWSFLSFGTQISVLESRKDLSMEIIKKDLRQQALELKTDQD
jgi:hypothetical protein